MKIQRIELRRFKSIREIILPEHNSGKVLENLIVLIGRNSSGKTNLLEAIQHFFGEFDPNFERAIGPVNPELWHGRNISEPIEWDITLKLEDSEVLALFGEELSQIFVDITDKKQVKVMRRISSTPQDMRWQTCELTIGGVNFVRDMEAVEMEEIAQILTAMAPVPTDLVQSVLSNLSALLKAQFKYIGAARDNVQGAPSFGNRSPIVNPATLSSINNMAQGTGAEVRNKWSPLRKKMEDTFPNRERVDSKGNQLFLGDEPLPATGGGAQSVMALIHDIESGPSIIGVEEPESHLHPELIKKTLRYFQDITDGDGGKQLFIATHSPFCVDTSYISGVVALYWDGQETKAKQIGSREDLRTALFDIGARPSDILFADVVLMVEGESDKIVLQGWARTLDVPVEEIHAAVIPVRGVNKTWYHLKLWCEVANDVGLPKYILVDKGGENEVTTVVNEGFVEQKNTYVLEQGSIEDYYDSEVLISALRSLFGVEVSEEQIPVGDRAKAIRKLIRKKPVEWKVPLAEEIAKKTTARKQINREVSDFLRRFYSENMR